MIDDNNIYIKAGYGVFNETLIKYLTTLIKFGASWNITELIDTIQYDIQEYLIFVYVYETHNGLYNDSDIKIIKKYIYLDDEYNITKTAICNLFNLSFDETIKVFNRISQCTHKYIQICSQYIDDDIIIKLVDDLLSVIIRQTSKLANDVLPNLKRFFRQNFDIHEARHNIIDDLHKSVYGYLLDEKITLENRIEHARKIAHIIERQKQRKKTNH